MHCIASHFSSLNKRKSPKKKKKKKKQYSKKRMKKKREKQKKLERKHVCVVIEDVDLLHLLAVWVDCDIVDPAWADFWFEGVIVDSAAAVGIRIEVTENDIRLVLPFKFSCRAQSRLRLDATLNQCLLLAVIKVLVYAD